jgi:cytochrome c553
MKPWWLLLACFACVDAADLDNGEEINEVCAACHGEFAQGGKDGEYPRLAGQPTEFIAKQLRLFRERKRQNMPMLPHTEARELPDVDIVAIAAYIAQIKLSSKLPPLDKRMDALQRLMQTKKTLNIPQTQGNVSQGQRLYNKECRFCHGQKGWGNPAKAVPMLAGQYTAYLWRQVDKYRRGERIHDEDEPNDELLNDFNKIQLQALFAYLATVDDE